MQMITLIVYPRTSSIHIMRLYLSQLQQTIGRSGKHNLNWTLSKVKYEITRRYLEEPVCMVCAIWTL